jgi:hypothetical protein
VGFHDPNSDGHSFRLPLARRLQHRVGFSDPCAGAEKYLQFPVAGPRGFLGREAQQVVGIGTQIPHDESSPPHMSWFNRRPAKPVTPMKGPTWITSREWRQQDVDQFDTDKRSDQATHAID